MKADKFLIDKLAHLSRLEFNEESKTSMINDLNKMLDFVEKLNELNTDGIVPLTHISSEINILRDDVPEINITREEALSNAHNHDSFYFRVPKVIDN